VVVRIATLLADKEHDAEAILSAPGCVTPLSGTGN